MNTVFIEALGYAMVVLIAASYILHNPRCTILSQCTGQLCGIVHFAFLGIWTPTIIGSCALIRDFTGVYIKQAYLNRFLLAITTVGVVINLYTFTHVMDLLPLVGFVACSTAVYFRDDYWPFRLWSSVSNVLWLVYALHIGSPQLLLMISGCTVLCFGHMIKTFWKSYRPVCSVEGVRAVA